jgi:hypothetical protein
MRSRTRPTQSRRIGLRWFDGLVSQAFALVLEVRVALTPGSHSLFNVFAPIGSVS